MKPYRLIAFCGLTTALGVVIMLLGAALGFGIYAAPMIVGLILASIGQKYGKRSQFLLFFSISTLSFLLVPEPEQNLMFFGLFGLYPILRPYFQRQRRVVRIILKVLYFNLVVIVLETLLLLVLIPESIHVWLAVLLLLAGNLIFFCYDFLIPRAGRLLEKYLGKLRLKE